MKIKINNTDYLVYQTSISPDRVQASIIDVTDVDDLLSDAKTTTEVVLYDDEDNMTDTFAGVTFLALCIMSAEDSISVEFERSKELRDLQNMIAQLQGQVENANNSTNEQLESVNQRVDTLEVSQEYQNDAIDALSGVDDTI